MADKFMYISNDDTQNYPSVDQNSIKVSKVVEPTNKKTLL